MKTKNWKKEVTEKLVVPVSQTGTNRKKLLVVEKGVRGDCISQTVKKELKIWSGSRVKHMEDGSGI